MQQDRTLRVLVANEVQERLDMIAALTTELGHKVVASTLEVDQVAGLTTRHVPDVALVGLGASSEHALELITAIVGQSECPVIVLLPGPDAEFVRQAASRGVFAYIDDQRAESLPSALEIVLVRFAEYHGLEGAFGRRALIEQAKGILMERHHIDASAAFEAMRSHSRNHNARLTDVAHDVIEGRLALPAAP